MSANFTPGPWKVVAGVSDSALEKPFGPEDGFAPFGGCGCCGSPWMNGDDAAQENANANLIAAAPDMYAALEGVIAVADRATVEFDAARAALAKARGEA